MIIEQIAAEDFRQYVLSSRLCSFNAAGAVIKAKTGHITFNLGAFPTSTRCTIQARRISGNGKLVVECGDKVAHLDVISQSSHHFYVDVGGSKEVTIRRHPNSIGDIQIFGITVEMLEPISEGQREVMISWKSILSKCHYDRLRLTGAGLFASEGASIYGANTILKIETDPENMFVVSDNRIKFVGSCKVVTLVVDPDVPARTKASFKTFPRPPEIGTPYKPRMPHAGGSWRDRHGHLAAGNSSASTAINPPIQQSGPPIILQLSNEFEMIENDSSKAHGEYIMPPNDGLKFVVIIPSYKNAPWVESNLKSVFSQTGADYRVLYVDDCSPDDTFEKARQITEEHGQSERVTLIRNTERKGALHNLYDGIHGCDDNEIIVTLDGDDWLAHDRVLGRLMEAYSDPNTWLTYGQYQSYPNNAPGGARQIPGHITRHSGFRQYSWCSTHLRTFYAWLFKNIRKEDLLDSSGKFYPMTWDLAFQFPMLEMGGTHCVFIPDVLYIYNISNPINDHKVNLRLQQTLEKEIRAKPKYDRL